MRAALDGGGVARAEGFKESFAQSDHALALDQDSQGAIDTVSGVVSQDHAGAVATASMQAPWLARRCEI